MRQLELLLLAGFAAGFIGCVARIDASAAAGDKGDNVKMAAADDDAGAPWAEAPDAAKTPAPRPDAATSAVAPKPAAAAPDASTPPTPPRQMDAGTMPMPPMAAMAAAGSMSPQPMDAGAACDFRGLVQAKCGNAACHGAPATGTGLDLTSASLAMRVAGRKGPNACASSLLIDTANPDQSALYLKVSGTSCGSQMPLGGTLTPSEQACVLSWIEAL